MTPFDKFKETAALVNLWITEEKPKIERFGCRNCSSAHSTHESFDSSVRTNTEFVTACQTGALR